jgi:cyclophilin family peptidyl-prolyl cis-trans isomerase
MNQTTWIVSGGIVIIVLAAVLYTMSGTGSTTVSTNDKDVTIAKVSDTASSSAPATDVTITTMPANTNTQTASNTKTVTHREEGSVKAISTVVLHTSMGDITLKLYKDTAPKTVENFTKLATSGFYDKVKFHRVIKGFMIQGGDPNSKDDTAPDTWGRGGPGYQFPDEIDPSSAVYQKGYKHGILAMANSGPNTNGSQFFIMAADYPLPPAYTIFGEVVNGLAVVDAIDSVKTDGSDRPVTPVVIESASVK